MMTATKTKETSVMKKPKKTLIEQAAHPAPTADSETNAGAETNADPREAQWRGCCRLAFNLHRRPNELAQLQAKLQNGYRIPYVDDLQLMPAALELVSNMAAAGVKRWDWLPPPSADDLADPAAWVARRLAERRAEQDEAERDRRLRQKEARAFGQSPAGGNGTGKPVYAQRLKRPLAEAGDSLERVMAQHQAEHGEFDPRWLDPHSPRFITGITNKEVIMMASEISGVRSRRPFEENVKIVTDWLRTRKQQKPDEAA
jgi:hypothetical protein